MHGFFFLSLNFASYISYFGVPLMDLKDKASVWNPFTGEEGHRGSNVEPGTRDPVTLATHEGRDRRGVCTGIHNFLKNGKTKFEIPDSLS